VAELVKPDPIIIPSIFTEEGNCRWEEELSPLFCFRFLVCTLSFFNVIGLGWLWIFW